MRRDKSQLWQRAVAVLVSVLFVGVVVAIAGALTFVPKVTSPGPPTAPTATAGSALEPGCELAEKFAKKGLLTRAEQLYADALPKPSASASPATPGAASGSNCSVDGLQYVAELRQYSAVLSAQGDAARGRGDEGTAKDLYTLALGADKANETAASGLRTLNAQPSTGFQRAKDRLSDTGTTVLAPLGQVLLWLLAFAVGFYLLVLLTKALSRAPWPLFRQRWRRQVLHGFAIGITVLGVAALGVGAGLVWVHSAGWWWLLGLCLGAALIVASWSWYLRLKVGLQLDVRDAKGGADAANAAYLAGQLLALGSDSPRGITLPRQTDVISLPKAALSFLPGGGFLSAALEFLSANIFVSPWHATVTLIDADHVEVCIERHGRHVDSVVADRCQLWFPGPEPAGVHDLADHALLTIAAAIILRTLADAHDELEQGLAGATKWQSIAGQVLAADNLVAHRESQKALFAHAVDNDLGNFTARVSYYRVTEGNATDGDGQRRFAESMSQICSEMKGPLRKEPLYLRVLFNRAIAWLNAYLFERAAKEKDISAWRKAEDRTNELIGHLSRKPPKEEKLADFWTQMRQRAGWLSLKVQVTNPDEAEIERPHPVLATVGQDGTIRRFSATNGGNIGEIGEPLIGTPATAVTASTAGRNRVLAVLGTDGTVTRWNAVTGDRLDGVLRGASPIAAYTPNGEDPVLAVMNGNGTIWRWNSATGRLIGNPLPVRDAIAVAAYAMGHTQVLVTMAADGTISSRDAGNGEPIRGRWHGTVPGAQAIAAYAMGHTQVLVTMAADGTISSRDAGNGEPIRGRWHGTVPGAQAIAAYAMGHTQVLVTMAADGTISSRDAGNGEPIPERWQGPVRDARAIIGYATAGNPALAILSPDGTITRWNLETGATIGEPLRGNPAAGITAYTLDNVPHLATITADGTITRWDAGNGEPIPERWQGPVRDARAIIGYATAGNPALAILSPDGTITRWNLETGATIGEPLRGNPAAGITAYTLHAVPHLATIAADGTITHWNPQTGKRVRGPSPGDASLGAITAYDVHDGEIWAAENIMAARQQYDCACMYASQRDYQHALTALQRAAADSELKRDARIDASFAELHDYPEEGDDPDGVRADKPSCAEVTSFYKIAGESGPSQFTGLAPFAKYDEALRAAGIHTGHDLLLQTDSVYSRRRLVRGLGISVPVIRQWHRIAELATHTPGLKLAQLDLLLAAGVDSPEELRRRTADDACKDLIEALRPLAFDHATPPPTRDMLRAWAGRQ